VPASTELEADATSALTEPEGAQTEWPGPLPGADPLPGQLDRWLASHGAELVATRRQIHAHPELSFHEFETAALVARELAVAGLSPRMLP
jgi:amidohydrolase